MSCKCLNLQFCMQTRYLIPAQVWPWCVGVWYNDSPSPFDSTAGMGVWYMVAPPPSDPAGMGVWYDPSPSLTPAGMYGHSAVYDTDTQSVLAYGGVIYGSPSPSPSLYSLHIPTRRWSLIRVPSQVSKTVSCLESGDLNLVIPLKCSLFTQCESNKGMCSHSVATPMLIVTHCFTNHLVRF